MAPGDLDVLFMIDNSSSMTEMQQKLEDQLPQFVSALEALPMGLPNIHIAVVSSDMGAPGDATGSIGCTSLGDQGMFQNQPRGTCTGPPLAAGRNLHLERRRRGQLHGQPVGRPLVHRAAR